MNDLKDIREAIAKLDTRLDKIEVVLVKQEKNLEYHIKRTDTLEQQLNPIMQSHQQVLGIGKLLTWGGVLLALAIGLKDLALFIMGVK